MRLSLLTIALVAAAGTAGAQTVTAPAPPAPKAGATVGSGSTGAAGATSYSVPSTSADSMINGGAAPKGNPGLNGAAAGPTANGSGQLTTNAQTGVQAGPGEMNANMANAPATRMTGAAGTAQRRIEQDGYKNVQNLQKGADGLWHGTAMRGNARVQVTVDRAGRVAAQ
jgi:hypothetical protein